MLKAIEGKLHHVANISERFESDLVADERKKWKLVGFEEIKTILFVQFLLDYLQVRSVPFSSLLILSGLSRKYL